MTTRIRHLETSRDLEAMLDATAVAFQSGYLDARRGFAEHQQRPRHRPELSRILEVDGRIASALRIEDRDFRIGAATFRLAGIGDVATHPDFRRKGYCAALLRETVEFMAADGFDLSLLFGIPDFYHRFGYATALCPVTLIVPAANLADLPSGTARPFAEGDLPVLSALLDADLEARACALVRDEAWWGYRKSLLQAITVVEHEGCPVAYFAAEERKDDLLVREAVAAPSPEAYQFVLWEIGSRAKRAGKETIRMLGLPPDHPIARCVCLQGARVEILYERQEGCMMRILCLHDTVRKLVPELERRLAASALVAGSARLGVNTDLGGFSLGIECGTVAVLPAAEPQVTLPHWALVQLMTGFASPRDLVVAGAATIAPEAVPWLEALFPQRWPMTLPNDGF